VLSRLELALVAQALQGCQTGAGHGGPASPKEIVPALSVQGGLVARAYSQRWQSRTTEKITETRVADLKIARPLAMPDVPADNQQPSVSVNFGSGARPPKNSRITKTVATASKTVQSRRHGPEGGANP